MRNHLRLFLLLLLLPLPCVAEDVTYPTSALDIQTHNEKLHFTVEVATTDAQHEHGLMFRKDVPDMHGMLFIFPQMHPLTFWMKNTLVPLDMLFVDDRGIITTIAENTVPESLTPVPSDGPARAVIEVAGGAAARHHIARGDKVIYPIFQ
jgi:uncharacterized membrane protein (UPF0127 family)